MPGPGKYNQKRLFDDVGTRDDYFGIEPERPPFGVQSKVINSFFFSDFTLF